MDNPDSMRVTTQFHLVSVDPDGNADMFSVTTSVPREMVEGGRLLFLLSAEPVELVRPRGVEG